MTTKNKPVHTIKIGNNQAAIWKNQSANGDFYNVTFNRSYEADGEIKNADSFSGTDLLAVSKLADVAHTWIMENKA